MKVVKPDEHGLREAATVIRTGGVVIYPTETVYGLGCEPSNADATRRVCEIKGRADNPLPIICADTETAERVVEFNAAARKLAEKFWPGPLTLVLPKKVDYPIWVNRGGKTLGVRVSGLETARRLAKLSGGVIVSTSANKTGKGPYDNAKDVIRHLGDEVNLVIDGGTTSGELPSTVLDLTGEELWILRSGPITGDQIVKTLKG
ncbi:MAG: L-threonylcarbamoyladenylate synthase [Candidatus Bathyarchaeota archaeon]|nr:L-threonylcarbamoyladenylate synthase [Candidatus Bathyarchaeota archaeon]